MYLRSRFSHNFKPRPSIAQHHHPRRLCSVGNNLRVAAHKTWYAALLSVGRYAQLFVRLIINAQSERNGERSAGFRFWTHVGYLQGMPTGKDCIINAVPQTAIIIVMFHDHFPTPHHAAVASVIRCAVCHPSNCHPSNCHRSLGPQVILLLRAVVLIVLNILRTVAIEADYRPLSW